MNATSYITAAAAALVSRLAVCARDERSDRDERRERS